MRIAQVAERSGFANGTKLSLALPKQIGLTPRQYRGRFQSRI